MHRMGFELHGRLAGLLRSLRGRDGGFATSPDGPSEVEPAALASLALGGDARARAWLGDRQLRDGGFRELDGRIAGPTSAALAALALRDGSAGRAYEYARAHRGLALPDARDPKLLGWSWTTETRSFVEPTSRMLLAARRLRPSDRGVIDDATRLLREWQTQDGGWNHGVAAVLGTELPGYAQTTAIALIALQRERQPFVQAALSFLTDTWQREPGGLTIAQSLVAFRFHRLPEQIDLGRAALRQIASERTFRERPQVVAWATLATGPDALLDTLRARA